MPELPELAAVAAYLSDRTVGETIAAVDATAFSVVKTYDPPLEALVGGEVISVSRHGKFLDIHADDVHLVLHLARAGWVRYSENLPSGRPKPSRSPLALRVKLTDGSGFDLTEAGTKKRLAAYVVRDPRDVDGVAALGIDPLSPDFTVDALAGIVSGRRSQIKGVLRDQKLIAGIGNAYSDEILHAATMSPFALASTLATEDVSRLHAAIVETLTRSVARAADVPLHRLKDSKRTGMRVHGRAGKTCIVCGGTVAEVSFADSSLQYCPTCQTGGKLLADRRMSRLLK